MGMVQGRLRAQCQYSFGSRSYQIISDHIRSYGIIWDHMGSCFGCFEGTKSPDGKASRSIARTHLKTVKTASAVKTETLQPSERKQRGLQRPIGQRPDDQPREEGGRKP